MERIKNALVRSWEYDRTSFKFEMVSVIFTIAGSMLLALTAENPNMLIVYPLFLVGAVTGFCAYYRREMVWTIMLTAYFIVVNIVGFIIALP